MVANVSGGVTTAAFLTDAAAAVLLDDRLRLGGAFLVVLVGLLLVLDEVALEGGGDCLT